MGTVPGEDTAFVGSGTSTGNVPHSAVELTGGTVNSRYRLTGPHSQWAVGTAHPAVDLLDHELVVLVYPNIPAGHEMDFYRRAAAEVERTRALRGTSLVCMRDCGALANTRPYFVMQRVQAHSVQKLVAEQGPISVDLAMQLADQIMQLTRRAHGFGVVLGDIRPANIFVTESRHSDGRRSLTPTVVDTGYARGLFDGLIALPEPPAAYRSPQRRRGEAATAADDIYALGALLSFLVTGRSPRLSTGEALDPAAWGPSRIRPDLRISPLLDRIVLRCLDPRPESRWRDVRTMQEAAEALRQVLTLPPAARALLDELLTSPPGGEPLGSLAGLGAGPRSNADVPTRQMEPAPSEAPEEVPPRHTATAPFNPRDVAALLHPMGSAAGGAAGGSAIDPGTRPLSTDQLRRLLRVIDSPEAEAAGSGDAAGACPLDQPRFSVHTSDISSVTPRTTEDEPPMGVAPPPGAAPRLVERRATSRTSPTAPLATLGASGGPAHRGTGPLLRVPTEPLVAVAGGQPGQSGHHGSSAPGTQTALSDAEPRSLAQSPGGGPVARSTGQSRLFDGRPLELPAEVHTIPPFGDEGPPRRTGTAHGRYGVVLGVAVACVLAAGFLLVMRGRTPHPAASPSPSASPFGNAGYLPSAAMGRPISGPALDLPTPRPSPAASDPAPQSTPPPSAPPTSLAAFSPQSTPPPSAPPTSPAAEAPRGRILAHIETRPTGARVLWAKTGEVLCPATPCDYAYPRLAAGKKMRLRLEAPGRAPAEVYIAVDASDAYLFELDEQ